MGTLPRITDRASVEARANYIRQFRHAPQHYWWFWDDLVVEVLMAFERAILSPADMREAASDLLDLKRDPDMRGRGQ